jgi:hypothetical protein
MQTPRGEADRDPTEGCDNDGAGSLAERGVEPVDQYDTDC